MTKEEINKAYENRWRIKSEHIEEKLELMLIKYRVEYVKELCRDFFEAGIAIGEGKETEQKVSYSNDPKNLFDRSIPFNQSVFTKENIQKYGQQMLQDFYEYWTEPNPSHTKMRFELQKTWDVNRRLARWARNNFNRYDRQSTKPDAAERLTDILIG